MASPTKITENRRAARSAKRVMKRNKKNNLKASKAKVRDCLKTLIDSGDIDVIVVTDEIRQKQSIPKQVKEILQINTTKPADKPANNNNLISWEAD